MRRNTPKEVNAFQRLVDDLESGELNLTLIDLAVKTWIERRKDLPEGVRNLLVRNGDQGSGSIRVLFHAMKQIIGCTEIAYRRGILHGEEETLKTAKT